MSKAPSRQFDLQLLRIIPNKTLIEFLDFRNISSSFRHITYILDPVESLIMESKGENWFDIKVPAADNGPNV
jgi:hypothetical protein